MAVCHRNGERQTRSIFSHTSDTQTRRKVWPISKEDHAQKHAFSIPCDESESISLRLWSRDWSEFVPLLRFIYPKPQSHIITFRRRGIKRLWLPISSNMGGWKGWIFYCQFVLCVKRRWYRRFGSDGADLEMVPGMPASRRTLFKVQEKSSKLQHSTCPM